MAMKFDGKTFAIIALVVIIFMFMQGQTQSVTTDDVVDTIKDTALEIINNIAGNPTLIIGGIVLITGLVILGKK